MTIFREFDGVRHEIELTSSELYAAYEVQQFYFDKDDILAMADGVDYPYDIPHDAFVELADEMAYRMRRNIDRYDMGWYEARDEAILDVVAEYEEGVKSVRS